MIKYNCSVCSIRVIDTRHENTNTLCRSCDKDFVPNWKVMGDEDYPPHKAAIEQDIQAELDDERSDNDI